MAKNGTLERRVEIYPSEYLKRLIVADAEDHNMPRAQILNKIVSDHYSSLPEERLQHLKNRAKANY
jgi:hypothetical protein